MLWIVLYGCGMGLEPMEKIADSSDSTEFEPGSEPDGMPSNEPSIDPLEVDDDGDGFSEEEGDCDDTTPNISPGNLETHAETKNHDA